MNKIIRILVISIIGFFASHIDAIKITNKTTEELLYVLGDPAIKFCYGGPEKVWLRKSATIEVSPDEKHFRIYTVRKPLIVKAKYELSETTEDLIIVKDQTEYKFIPAGQYDNMTQPKRNSSTERRGLTHPTKNRPRILSSENRRRPSRRTKLEIAYGAEKLSKIAQAMTDQVIDESIITPSKAYPDVEVDVTPMPQPTIIDNQDQLSTEPVSDNTPKPKFSVTFDDKQAVTKVERESPSTLKVVTPTNSKVTSNLRTKRITLSTKGANPKQAQVAIKRKSYFTKTKLAAIGTTATLGTISLMAWWLYKLRLPTI